MEICLDIYNFASYEYRQMEALAGYAAGMQSPLYYQWLHEAGAQEAAARAVRAIVTRLRQRQIPASTADFLAFQTTLAGLSRLRGHAAPLRHDVLDAAQSAKIIVKLWLIRQRRC